MVIGNGVIYFPYLLTPVRAKHSDDKLSIFITGYFPVRAKHSDDKLSIFITGYFPNASPLLRPYFAPTTPDSCLLNNLMVFAVAVVVLVHFAK
ncbi:MAG: hypothetical protein ACKPB7_36710 [Sphaerospermopsis kisseleviana]